MAVTVRARVAVFLDAVLPDATAPVHQTPDTQRVLLEEHADESGLLEPWLSWWPADLVEQMLPDANQRAMLCAEQERLAVSFYDHDVALPPRWVHQDPSPSVARTSTSWRRRRVVAGRLASSR